MNRDCALHTPLMEALTDIKVASAQTRNDVLWVKRGVYGLLVVAMAVFACFYNLDKRVTACETKVATQERTGDIPRWMKTSPKSK
jgi:elongation factor P--beta-lysine ligase